MLMPEAMSTDRCQQKPTLLSSNATSLSMKCYKFEEWSPEGSSEWGRRKLIGWSVAGVGRATLHKDLAC